MSIASVQQQLSTPDGFTKAVTAKSGVYAGAIGALIASAVGIGMNLFQLGSASNWNWRLIERYFLDAGAVQFTGSRSSRAEFWRFLYVWGPVILIPLAIILLIVHFTTRKTKAASLFNDFQARGWVGRQRFTGLTVQNGRAQTPVVFISHPSMADEELDAIAQQYGAYISSLDKKGLKETSKAAMKAGALTGVSASALSPNLPPAITASAVQGKGEFVAVIPPAAAGNKFQILPITA